MGSVDLDYHREPKGEDFGEHSDACSIAQEGQYSERKFLCPE